MILVGAAAGLWLNRMERHDAGPPRQAVPQPQDVTSAANLLGLKYLRADTNMVLAIQPGGLLANGTGAEGDTKTTLGRIGIPPSVLDTFERAGIPWKSIDHAVLGAAIRDDVAEIPPFTLALVLREPLADVDKFLKALQARRSSLGNRTVHQVNLAALPGVLAWKATPTVWIFTLHEADLPAAEGGSGPTSATLRDLFTNRLQPEFPLWLAVDEADWAQKPSVKALAILKQKQDWLPRLARLRALAIGLEFGAVDRQQVVIRASDDDTARTLAKEWAELKPTVQGREVSIVAIAAADVILGQVVAGLEKALAP